MKLFIIENGLVYFRDRITRDQNTSVYKSKVKPFSITKTLIQSFF